MSDTLEFQKPTRIGQFGNMGMFWLLVAVIGAGVFYLNGINELLDAWQKPEYSHGPLIPVLSALLFLRQLKSVPVNPGPVSDRWPGVAVLVFALLLGLAGNLIQIADFVAYGLILWVGGILLISFGWNTGKHFWPPVLHLVYMLPLPGAIYYGVSTYLQFISSELGVYFLQVLRVPVFLEGNIIDLGVYKLQVAEACSGLRYLFPILSFSYIFSVLYQGPMWHKAVLLISAAPITIVMNSARIALAGYIVNSYGLEYVEGFTHFFEGWVIFLVCIVLLFLLAWVMVKFRRDRITLVEALDLETEGLAQQATRLKYLQPSAALITAAVLMTVIAGAWAAQPERRLVSVDRDPFVLFPTQIGEWTAGQPLKLDPDVEVVLAADDYLSVSMANPQADAPVDLFMAWYKDQSTGGVHSPEVCLPGGGWEIARLEQIDVSPLGGGDPISLNRVVIQKGVNRMLVYFWYEQQGSRTSSMYEAKFALMIGKLTNSRNDSAIVRLTTQILPGENESVAEERLISGMTAILGPLDRFVPGI